MATADSGVYTQNSSQGRIFAFSSQRLKRVGFWLALALVIAAPVSGVLSYTILSDLEFFGIGPGFFRIWLTGNVILLLLLAGLVVWQVTKLVIARRSGLAGSGLHSHLMLFFGLIAIIPTLIVAVFSYITIDYALKLWSSEFYENMVDNSRAVGSSYYDEHRRNILRDGAELATYLNRAEKLYAEKPELFANFINEHAYLRNLDDVYLVDSDGLVLVAAKRRKQSQSPSAIHLPAPPDLIKKAETGRILFAVHRIPGGGAAEMVALLRLSAYTDIFLYIGRNIDGRIIDHLLRTQYYRDLYQQLKSGNFNIQITFAFIFGLLALLLLFAAILVGLWLANRLAAPAGALITAANRISDGDLNVQIEQYGHKGEWNVLSEAFNRMTGQLRTQKQELVGANRKLDARRQFIEAVLAGVSAGVIGVDEKHRLRVINKKAEELLQLDAERDYGAELVKKAPELAGELRLHAKAPSQQWKPLKLVRKGEVKELLVRFTRTDHDGKTLGRHVITIDDVTRLVDAQRMAIWRDAARRIAHEIKNPLTPILLSAERLRRREFTNQKKERAIVEQCTDAIIRHVDNIKRMVDEFSAFARMPKPVMRRENVTEAARQAVFLQQLSEPGITFGLIAPDRPIEARCDVRLIAQALINLLKNAAEAIHEHFYPHGKSNFEAHIRVELACEQQQVVIQVLDNGGGLPANLRTRLGEPYVTMKKKGTGLGLAIVQNILDEHGGTLNLRETNEEGRKGTCVTVSFPVNLGDEQTGGDDSLLQLAYQRKEETFADGV